MENDKNEETGNILCLQPNERLPQHYFNMKLWLDEYSNQVNHEIIQENIYSKYILSDNMCDNEQNEATKKIGDENNESFRQWDSKVKRCNPSKKKNSIIRTPVYVRTLFPFSKKINYENLQMTEVGLYSISNRHDSSTLTGILNRCTQSWGMTQDEIVITDGTSGIGGNTLAFANVFKKVNAIEWDMIQYEALKNNVAEYQLKNVKCYFGNCLRIIPMLNQHIIFLDPPWGGKSYKKEKELNLDIGGIPIIHIINSWRNRCKKLQMVVVKIPKNFSLLEFANNCNFPFMFLLYFRKYNVLILSERFCKPIAQRHFISYVKDRRCSF